MAGSVAFDCNIARKGLLSSSSRSGVDYNRSLDIPSLFLESRIDCVKALSYKLCTDTVWTSILQRKFR